MRQAYLKLTAISNNDNSQVTAFIRHDIIGSMHEENGHTLIMYVNVGGVKVVESIKDILRMLESPVISLNGDEIDIETNKHTVV